MWSIVPTCTLDTWFPPPPEFAFAIAFVVLKLSKTFLRNEFFPNPVRSWSCEDGMSINLQQPAPLWSAHSDIDHKQTIQQVHVREHTNKQTNKQTNKHTHTHAYMSRSLSSLYIAKPAGDTIVWPLGANLPFALKNLFQTQCQHLLDVHLIYQAACKILPPLSGQKLCLTKIWAYRVCAYVCILGGLRCTGFSCFPPEFCYTPCLSPKGLFTIEQPNGMIVLTRCITFSCFPVTLILDWMWDALVGIVK